MPSEVARDARAPGTQGESAPLPLKIERSVRSGRTRSRRARLSDLPLESLRVPPDRSEEHTSELQSQSNLVCRLLLEKKKKHTLSQKPHATEPVLTFRR